MWALTVIQSNLSVTRHIKIPFKIINMCTSWFQTKNQKKARSTANHVAEEVYGGVPHSFVFHRGQIGKNVGQLIMDVRRVMEPFTAESLKVCVELHAAQTWLHAFMLMLQQGHLISWL